MLAWERIYLNIWGQSKNTAKIDVSLRSDIIGACSFTVCVVK